MVHHRMPHTDELENLAPPGMAATNIGKKFGIKREKNHNGQKNIYTVERGRELGGQKKIIALQSVQKQH